MFDAVTPKRIFTPLMGIGILLGIFVSARRSWLPTDATTASRAPAG